MLRDARRLRSRIGVSGQFAAVDEELTGAENLEMVGRLYHLGTGPSRQRARELLERFDLVDAADRTVKGYSGGMRRRLDLAGALVARPPVLFLDEPTTGLDPRARRDLWDVITELVASGTTLLLTTQYLEEADRLADRIAVVDNGKVIGQGTADALKDRVGGDQIELTVHDAAQVEAARRMLASLTGGDVRTAPGSLQLTAPVAAGAASLTEALVRLASEGVTPRDVALRRPTLDDVFLTLTGHEAGATAAAGTDKEKEPAR